MFHVKQDRRADTIFALATATGKAGIAVVRVSGAQSFEVLRLTTRKQGNPRVACYTGIVHPTTGELIDNGVVTFFNAPGSFTGEDVVEFAIHGGRAVIEALLEALSVVPGVRTAEAGEFTRRAFLNGKLDLTEVEGLADLLNAETEAQRRQALSQASGTLRVQYENWANRLLALLAREEALLDFPEEDDPALNALDTSLDIGALEKEISAHLMDAHNGERLREGVTLAVVGAPNAGKSSLVNALVRRDLAIVSDVPGTTRDVLEGHVDLGGYPLIIVDTAGIRKTRNAVEQEGIRRALLRAEEADIVLHVMDGTHPDSISSNVLLNSSTNPILVRTRLDLVSKEERFSRPGMWVSTISRNGLDELQDLILTEIRKLTATRGSIAPTRWRHREILHRTLHALEAAIGEPPGEFRAERLRQASQSLGELTGKVRISDVLDRIFDEFCIGK